MASEIKVDTVSEKTSANGVTIDGLNIKDSKIVTANSIDSDVYIDGSIDTAHIAADAITEAKIADDAINSEHYTDGSIDTAHLADGQVTIGKLATAVLTGATDIGEAIVDADLFLVDNGAGGTLRKTAASRLKTFIGGGITHAAQWRQNQNETGDIDPVTNLEQNDSAGYSNLGAVMTLSSGIFTFPVTGYYLVQATFGWFMNGDSAYCNVGIQATTDNSNYTLKAYAPCLLQATSSQAGFGNATASFIFDVTNKTNCKVKFYSDVQNNSTTLMGGSSYNTGTHITFIRLGDT